ncbi:RNA polymerase sigma-70 factor, ECF subfamily [Ekhidna lutea]|uniref:RNA polymerase sigma-70 factor, ECF subfamily n=1 Tax=Ekhidna lutea TaxID=447679 RepID=A0A239M2U8_EKHLU|nr:sigma-70 family RNA polymerase sigma factor [Ekhidna lutea]SNT36274.1 RNA polymerase sigma-70 factor, ECF subfamily [Ekhidna lutea]
MSHNLYHKEILPASDGMYRYALSIVREPETAKDIVQDCLTKIWSIRKDLDKVEKVNAWAFRIVRNRCIEILRRNRYADLDEKVVNMRHSDPVEEQAITNDFMSLMRKVLKELPVKQQEVFHLREVEDMSYQDIAETCGLTESDVKVNIHRARKKVKEAMQKIDAYGIAN